MGWQSQAHGASVQAEIESAIEKFSGETPRLHFCAGRTDAGVHALGQVAHFDLERVTDGRTVREAPERLPAASAHRHPGGGRGPIGLPTPGCRPGGGAIAIWFSTARPGRRWISAAFGTCHTPWISTPCAREPPILSGSTISQAFGPRSARRSRRSKRSTRLDILHEGDVVTFAAEARSFLHHQIRNMVGTLILVGRGKWRSERVAEAPGGARPRRRRTDRVARRKLYLVGVDYP